MNVQHTSKSFSSSGVFAVISILTFLCFSPDLKNDLLHWDDFGYIVNNPYIQNLSIETVRWAFSSFYCNYWAPLTWISLAFDYALWGLNPFGYHLTNNILHALNTGMFFYLSLELFSNHFSHRHMQNSALHNHSKQFSLWCSALAALIFALHPLRVESVVWAAERKDVLSLFFGIPAVYAYLIHTRSFQPVYNLVRNVSCFFLSSPYYWFAFLFFCLSILSKPMLITLPAVLLILDWYPLKRLCRVSFISIMLEKILFIIASGVVGYISFNSQKPQMLSLKESGIFSRILIAFKSVASYIWFTVWPVDISPFYVYPLNMSLTTNDYIISAVVVITVTAISIIYIKSYPIFICLWSLYLIMLYPVLGFNQVGPQAMAARFTYSPSLPISFFIALLLSSAIIKYKHSKLMLTALSSFICCLLFFYCFVTLHHIPFWKNDVTLWSRTIDLDPSGSGRAYFQRSHAYIEKGEYLLALTDINMALDIAIRKKYRALHEIYPSRAQILTRLGNYSGAIADYNRALTSASDRDRGMIFMARGALFQLIGETRQAEDDFINANSIVSGPEALKH